MSVSRSRVVSAACLGALLLPLGCSTALTTVKEEEKLMRSSEEVPRPAPRWGIVVHGGAGTLQRSALTPEREAAIRAALAQALQAGHAVLARGGTSLDAVEAALCVLEDSPYFNAGKGAVFSHEGRNELDASLMDGHTRAAGAVAGLRHVKNPIRLARAVMEHSPHVMMVGEGAESFAQTQGVELVPESYFRTEERWQDLQRALEEEKKKAAPSPAAPAPTPAPAPSTAARVPRGRGPQVRHRGRGGAGPGGPPRRGHLHGGHDEQALWPRGGLAHHRRGHLRQMRRCAVSRARATASTSSATPWRETSAPAWSCKICP